MRKFCAPKFDCGNCQFRNLVGRALRGCCLRAVHAGGALPAVMEIAEFAGTLKVGNFCAVNVAREEVHSEGAPVWL